MTYTLAANLLNLLVSVASSLLIPIVFGADIDQYGLFQVYLFYVSYIGFFHFGLCDGILLVDGGKHYCDLDKASYSFQYHALNIFEILLSIGITIYFLFFSETADYLFIAIAFCFNLIVFIPRNFLSFTLQATNRLKHNAMITIIGRSLYLICILICIVMHISDYRAYVIADIVGKIIALVYAVIVCSDIVFAKLCSFKSGFKSLSLNVSVGIKMMLASISSMVVTGIVRIAIQYYWDIETYGKVSLTLSVTNLVLLFICAMATVIYPMLKRTSDEMVLKLYPKIRDLIMLPLFLSLVFCYPMQKVLVWILPGYADSLVYLPVLFPVCVYSAKVTLLIQTYMQVYRMEKDILKVNLSGIIFTLILTIISVIICGSLSMAIFTILMGQAFRCIYAEYILSRKMEMSIFKDCMIEGVLVFTFALSSYYIGNVQGLLIYIPLLIVYVFFKRNGIQEAFAYLRSL